LAQNSRKEVTDLARNGRKFQRGPNLEAFTVGVLTMDYGPKDKQYYRNGEGKIFSSAGKYCLPFSGNAGVYPFKVSNDSSRRSVQGHMFESIDNLKTQTLPKVRAEYADDHGRRGQGLLEEVEQRGGGPAETALPLVSSPLHLDVSLFHLRNPSI
jgi:hypothetical protein